MAVEAMTNTSILELCIMNDVQKNFLTKAFYISIGVAASSALFLVFYWSLRLNASIANLINNYAQDLPLYFWPYVILTLGAIVLFGVNVSLFVYRSRKFGLPRLNFRKGENISGQAATGLGSLIGVFASACPVCGSTLLSAIGIAGGLTAFPLGGLELKAVSLGLLVLPIWLTVRDVKRKEGECQEGICPPPSDHSFREKDKPWLQSTLALIFIFVFVGFNMLKTDPAVARLLPRESKGIVNPGDNQTFTANVSATGNELVDEVNAAVLPERGFQSRIYFGESVVKLIEAGAIDRSKFEALYESRGGLPKEVRELLDRSSAKPILLTRETANYYINLLWPLGLANFMETNKNSPVNGKSLFNFASTGGWDLGKEKNGGAYFNKFKIIPLTSAQEQLATRIAENTFRPCCGNSTFFQDCNHGSALLGLLELGAAQGLTEDELFREALAFNSFWFPHNYIQTALYFKAVKGIDWENVDPRVVMSKDYSSGGGWYENVQKELAARNLIPEVKGGASCGV